MDFSIPQSFSKEMSSFQKFLASHLKPHLSKWNKGGHIPRDFFQALGSEGWLGFQTEKGRIVEDPSIKQALFFDSLARLSPGVGIAVLVQISLGLEGIWLFGNKEQKETYLPKGIKGETLFCLGNTEPNAGSDAANIATRAEKADGGWTLNGIKSYVTNGSISDWAIISAITDPEAPRTQRSSLFLVNLSSNGVSRTMLNKRVWIPSDLSRIHLKDVFVPDENLLGTPGKGLQQVLEIFSHSRITISALTLGTAAGAFELGLDHAKKRVIFGKPITEFQAKAFETADFYSRLEAAQLVVLKACWIKDQGKDFRLESSMAKYLTVGLAKEVGDWAADIFGAASVIFDHPIHKFPMDAWASALGEGTQDVQKLVIFRELMKRSGDH